MSTVKLKKLYSNNLLLSLFFFVFFFYIIIYLVIKINTCNLFSENITLNKNFKKVQKNKNKKKKNEYTFNQKISNIDTYSNTIESFEYYYAPNVIEINRPCLTEKDLDALYNKHFNQKNRDLHNDTIIAKSNLAKFQKKGSENKKKEKNNNEKNINKSKPKINNITKNGRNNNDKKIIELKKSNKKNVIEPIMLPPVIVSSIKEYHKEKSNAINNQDEMFIKKNNDTSIFLETNIQKNENSKNEQSNSQDQQLNTENTESCCQSTKSEEESDGNSQIDQEYQFNLEDGGGIEDQKVCSEEEYNSFTDRILKNISRFPGKKKHCCISFFVKDNKPESISIDPLEHEKISYAYKAHLIASIERIDIPFCFRYKKLKIII